MFGAGAIGATVGGWIAEHYDKLYFYDLAPVAKALKENGLTLYQGDAPEKKTKLKVKVLDDLAQAKDAEVVALAVKNYQLEAAARAIHDKLGDKPIIVSLANGRENQEILPRYFSKVVCCVLIYNGWKDEAEVAGYNKKGPLIIGTLKNDLQEELKGIARIFNLGVETVISDRIQDAVHCKIVVNLANSTTTLVGFRYREIADWKTLQKLMTSQLWEGVEVIRAMGYQECRLGGMPPWKLIWLGAKLPFVAGSTFRKNLSRTNLTSMGQDVLQRKSSETELESLNGYIVRLAEKHGVKTPYNKTIYEICKKEFAKPDFKPWTETEIWEQVKRAL
jgi:2-dehydropantoate 2-reductase